MSAAAVAAPPAEEPTDAEAPKKRGPPVVIIDSGNTNVAGGISGRALASRVKTFQDGSNVWVREKTEETDAPEVVEARREALRAKAVIGDGEGVELDAEKAKQEALGGVSEETMDKTAREIQCFRLAAFDVNIDELEVKEWLGPDADPSDYFNYGMGEDTWRQYRDQQLILRRSLQERRAAMAQAAARERHAELLKQGPPQPPTLPMPIMGARPPWGGGPMPPPNAFPPRGFPGQGFPRVSCVCLLLRLPRPDDSATTRDLLSHRAPSTRTNAPSLCTQAGPCDAAGAVADRASAPRRVPREIPGRDRVG